MNKIYFDVDEDHNIITRCPYNLRLVNHPVTHCIVGGRGCNTCEFRVFKNKSEMFERFIYCKFKGDEV